MFVDASGITTSKICRQIINLSRLDASDKNYNYLEILLDFPCSYMWNKYQTRRIYSKDVWQTICSHRF